MRTKKMTPQERYDKKNRVTLTLKLNRKTDADILSWLDAQDNKQGIIKDIIREKIKR